MIHIKYCILNYFLKKKKALIEVIQNKKMQPRTDMISSKSIYSSSPLMGNYKGNVIGTSNLAVQNIYRAPSSIIKCQVKQPFSATANQNVALNNVSKQPEGIKKACQIEYTTLLDKKPYSVTKSFSNPNELSCFLTYYIANQLSANQFINVDLLNLLFIIENRDRPGNDAANQEILYSTLLAINGGVLANNSNFPVLDYNVPSLFSNFSKTYLMSSLGRFDSYPSIIFSISTPSLLQDLFYESYTPFVFNVENEPVNLAMNKSICSYEFKANGNIENFRNYTNVIFTCSKFVYDKYHFPQKGQYVLLLSPEYLDSWNILERTEGKIQIFSFGARFSNVFIVKNKDLSNVIDITPYSYPESDKANNDDVKAQAFKLKSSAVYDGNTQTISTFQNIYNDLKNNTDYIDYGVFPLLSYKNDFVTPKFIYDLKNINNYYLPIPAELYLNTTKFPTEDLEYIYIVCLSQPYFQNVTYSDISIYSIDNEDRTSTVATIPTAQSIPQAKNPEYGTPRVKPPGDNVTIGEHEMIFFAEKFHKFVPPLSPVPENILIFKLNILSLKIEKPEIQEIALAERISYPPVEQSSRGFEQPIMIYPTIDNDCVLNSIFEQQNMGVNTNIPFRAFGQYKEGSTVVPNYPPSDPKYYVTPSTPVCNTASSTSKSCMDMEESKMMNEEEELQKEKNELQKKEEELEKIKEELEVIKQELNKKKEEPKKKKEEPKKKKEEPKKKKEEPKKKKEEPKKKKEQPKNKKEEPKKKKEEPKKKKEEPKAKKEEPKAKKEEPKKKKEEPKKKKEESKKKIEEPKKKKEEPKKDDSYTFTGRKYIITSDGLKTITK